MGGDMPWERERSMGKQARGPTRTGRLGLREEEEERGEGRGEGRDKERWWWWSRSTRQCGRCGRRDELREAADTDGVEMAHELGPGEGPELGGPVVVVVVVMGPWGVVPAHPPACPPARPPAAVAPPSGPPRPLIGLGAAQPGIAETDGVTAAVVVAERHRAMARRPERRACRDIGVCRKSQAIAEETSV